MGKLGKFPQPPMTPPAPPNCELGNSVNIIHPFPESRFFKDPRICAPRKIFFKSRKIFVNIPALLSRNQGKVTKQVALWGKYEISYGKIISF